MVSFGEERRPKVGVASIVTNPSGKIVLGKRKNSHGAGTWQFPGGHLEYQEDVLVCAEREAEEETGLKVKGLKIVAVKNNIFHKEEKHYITLFVHCVVVDADAQPQVTEPDKCENWYWKTWEEIRAIKDAGGPENQLFLPVANLLDDTADLHELTPGTRSA